ncbi:phosphotransferase family protein [Microlunatus sp. GCM10028923]|uniref:phosphotransferase family protein n=1 Tax=Microlunatus sp. GCM10028923 TaxID=3273400 RepID=UPI003609186A
MGGGVLDGLIGRASEVLGRRLELVGRLSGGAHALTAMARDAGGTEYVVRRFPIGDPAVVEEVRVLDRLGSLGGLAPRLVAYDAGQTEAPIIVTTKLDGGPPSPDLSPFEIAAQLGSALAKIHTIDGRGLRRVPGTRPTGDGPAVEVDGEKGDQQERSGAVLVHYDFWCGNALWRDGTLTGVVDWSGARQGPRAVDVAWCRQDLVLLGSPESADHFLRVYEEQAGVEIDDVRAWDLDAARSADGVVETWAVNYEGIGRPEITGKVLRERLDGWIARLLDGNRPRQ